MPSGPRTIHVVPGSEIDRLLEAAAETPVELERDGVRYRLDRIDELPASQVAESAPEKTRPEPDEEYTLESAFGSVTPATNTATLDALIADAKEERADRAARSRALRNR